MLSRLFLADELLYYGKEGSGCGKEKVAEIQHTIVYVEAIAK